MKKFALAFASTLMLLSNPSYSQSNISWKVMPLVTFNFPQAIGTQDQKQWAHSLWKSELDRIGGVGGQGRPAFILLGVIETQANTYIFSSMDAAGICESPPNGDGTSRQQPSYASCNLKLTTIDKAKNTTKTTTVLFKNFCHISETDDTSAAHIQLGHDIKYKRALFRTIDYGRHVRSCDRSIQLK